MKIIVTAAFSCACAGSLLVSCNRDKSIASDTTKSEAVPTVEVIETRPPAAIPVAEPEEFRVAEEEPGSIGVVDPTPGQRLDHAIEETDETIRKATEATGRGIRRAGQAIERKADEESR